MTASGTKPHTINEQTDPSWEGPDQTSTSLTSSTKNLNQSKPKSTLQVNLKTPKAKFGTTNLSRILSAHQTLCPYLYPQKTLPRIVLSDQLDSYQFIPWPPRRKLLPQPPPGEEDRVPYHHRHCPPLHPPQRPTSFNKSKQPLMPPSAAPEEEETQEETLQEEDRVHLDPQAVEELCRILQYLLHKYQSQQQLMFAPWVPPHIPSQENMTKQKTGSTNYEDIIVLTLESQGLNHQFVKWPWHSHLWTDQRSPNGPEP